ncbi:MAG: efflux RND transporter periplasmic adaptor subunit [Phascolarctobacterium sp.]|nr:efflux RND transporter periplasmic adaptor subunit [Phascolarctobacterium sp.]
MLENYTNQPKAMAVAAIVCVAGVCYGLFLRFSPQPVEEKIIPVVRTITAGDKEGTSQVEYPGELKGRFESNLAFQVAGKINSRLVNVGDKVSQGQVLMTLDTKDVIQGALSSNAALEAAQANQKLAEDNFKRYAELHKQGAISQATYDNFKTQLAAANAQLRQAQAQASVSGNQLDYATLKSDANGVVAKVLAEVGQVTGAGTPVVTVVQDGEREVQINVPESALKNLKIGDTAKISFWALHKIETQGTVREISPIADTLTRTYKVCVSIQDIPEEAKLGMTAKVSFQNSGSGQALTIPASCIYQVNNQPAVWLVNQDNKVELQDVEILNYAGNDVLIKSGVKAGDIVVTAGIAKLTKGQEVRLEKNGGK